ncbi:hypothetical protein [Aggregatibacter kilianii]|uniref:hypothetical protein n=1 Tax=Aggregatibacter kilianii TaxID=2025884 RepID=UPI000D64D516|nr:hypothetical protein [Aggregatibacter kilianii]
MFGFVFSILIALGVLFFRGKFVIKRVVVVTFIFFLVEYLFAKFISFYPKEEVMIYRETIKYSVVLYFEFLVNLLFIFMVNRIIFLLESGDFKWKRLLVFYEKVYLCVYILGNLLINYGVWLN